MGSLSLDAEHISGHTREQCLVIFQNTGKATRNHSSNCFSNTQPAPSSGTISRILLLQVKCHTHSLTKTLQTISIYIHYKYSFYIYIYTNAYSRQIHACFFSPVCCLMATEPRLAPSIALLVQTAHSPSYCVSCGPRTRRLCLDAMVLRLQGSCSSKSA